MQKKVKAQTMSTSVPLLSAKHGLPRKVVLVKLHPHITSVTSDTQGNATRKGQ
jgi:hypothetical protein